MTTPSPEPLAHFDEGVRAFLCRHGLIPGKTGENSVTSWAIGLSGGGDSVFLLHLLLRHKPPGLSLTLLHFDHHTDPEQNRRDRLFTEEIARRLSLPIVLGHSPAAAISRPDVSETLLRTERHAFFSSFLDRHPECVLFLGHQADDRIETILANLFTGGGPRSLLGISPQSGRIFRPLLPFHREEIRRALSQSQIPWSDDPGNDNPAYRRNRIRHELRPFLDRFFPPAGSWHINRLASLMEREIDRTLPVPPATLCMEEGRGHIRFSLFLYHALRPSAQGAFVRALLEQQSRRGLPVPEERNLLRTLETAGAEKRMAVVPVGHGWKVRVVQGRVDLVYQYSENLCMPLLFSGMDPDGQRIALARGGALEIRPLSGETTAAVAPFLRRPGRSCIVFPPLEKGEEAPGLTVTYWTPGLRILPGGDQAAGRKVSSIWKSRKVPEVARQRWPVLCMGEYAVWIPGLLDQTAHLGSEGPGRAWHLTYLERERSEWKKFLENP